jgi:hypothetical protein
VVDGAYERAAAAAEDPVAPGAGEAVVAPRPDVDFEDGAQRLRR